MAVKEKIPYYTNLGGLNTRVNDPLVEANEALIARNVIFRSWAEIDQRGGFQAQITAPTVDKVRVIHQHVERATNNKTRLMLKGTSIYSIQGSTETVLESALSPSSSLGASAQLFDNSVICTGADNPRSFSNTLGLNEIDTGAFNPQWCVSFANFMVYGGDQDLPQRIVFSSLGDATTVNENQDFIDILDADQKITGAFVLFNSLWVTSIGSITKIDGSDFTATSEGFNATVRTIWRGDGSVNHQSIVVAHDRAYFLGRYAIYEFDGRSVKDISDKIEPFFRDGTNRSIIDQTVSVHDEENNVIIISVASGNTTIPDTHFIYHYETALMCWSTWNDFLITYWYAMEEDGEFPIIWHGDSLGNVYRHGNEDDDIYDVAQTSLFPVDFRYKTGWQHLNGPARRFLLKHLYAIAQGVGGDTFECHIFRDYSTQPHIDFPKTLTIPITGPIWGAVTWGQFVWGGDESQYLDKISAQSSVWRNYAVEWRHKSLGKKFALVGWTTSVIPKGLAD